MLRTQKDLKVHTNRIVFKPGDAASTSDFFTMYGNTLDWNEIRESDANW